MRMLYRLYFNSSKLDLSTKGMGMGSNLVACEHNIETSALFQPRIFKNLRLAKINIFGFKLSLQPTL